MTVISDHAFSRCSSLKSITIPRSVTRIGKYAFYNCTNLKSIVIPNSVKVIDDHAFENCHSLKSITFPDSLTTIGELAFKDCQSLTSIVIPDSVTAIGRDAFDNCKKLTSIVVPDSVTSIGSWIFFRCDALSESEIPIILLFHSRFAREKQKAILMYLAGIGKYTAKDQITFDTYLKRHYIKVIEWLSETDNVAALTYFMDKGIITVHNIDRLIEKANSGKKGQVLATLLNFKNEQFTQEEIEAERERKRCIELNSDPRNLTNMRKTWDIIYHRDGTCRIAAYKGADIRITIPAMVGKRYVTKIGSPYRSNGMHGAESIVIPDTVTLIDGEAFVLCDKLTSIVIPDSVKTIGNWVFYSCSSLTSIVIPDSVTQISDSAFDNCDSTILTIHTPKHSYAWDYAIANNYKHEELANDR
jgi:hypothetical protein